MRLIPTPPGHIKSGKKILFENKNLIEIPEKKCAQFEAIKFQ